MKPPVLVTRRLPAVALTRLQQNCEVDLHADRTALAPNDLRERVCDKAGIVCVLTDGIDRSVIEAGSHLSVIANVAVGHDNIDVGYARSKNIVVTNTPDVLTEAVADFTWGLILAISRRIVEGDHLVRAGKWGGWALDFMLGTELRGKQVGIVGAGRVGRAVAARARAFGAHVVFAKSQGTTKTIDESSRRPATDQSDVHWCSLDELLVTSDVVSLHVPLTVKTRHLIDRRAFTRMKRTAYLINTSRGLVIDEDALVWALGERLISGAALDVYEHEPKVHPGLLAVDNVVLAPHLGSATRETRTAMAQLAVANVVAVLSGQAPLTPVG